jgi:hypothetical protein
VSRQAARLWIGLAGLAIFGGSWIAIFRFALPNILLLIGPLLFILCSLGVERLVPLTVEEQAERNQEILQSGSELHAFGIWGFMRLSLTMLVLVVAIVLIVNWLDTGMRFVWPSQKFLIVMGFGLAALIVAMPLTYWMDRQRLDRASRKIEQDKSSNAST